MKLVVLSDLIVIVLAIGSKVCQFKPGRRRLIFKGDKINNMNYFGEEEKPSTHVVVRYGKDPCGVSEIFRHNSLLRVSAGICQTAVVDE
jgi:hypothetical protein